MNFSWDKNESEEVRIFREMLWGDPREVYKIYGRKKLKEVFITQGHKADRRNLSFWKTILKIKGEDLEVNKDPRKSFRRDCRIWNY